MRQTHIFIFLSIFLLSSPSVFAWDINPSGGKIKDNIGINGYLYCEKNGSLFKISTKSRAGCGNLKLYTSLNQLREYCSSLTRYEIHCEDIFKSPEASTSMYQIENYTDDDTQVNIRINENDYNYCLTFQGDLKREKKPFFHELCSYENGTKLTHGSSIVYNINKFCSDLAINEFSKNPKICAEFRVADNKLKNNPTSMDTAQVPITKVDINAPILDVADRITVYHIDYSISGRIEDDSEVFLEADGNSIIVSNNKFQINGSTPIGLNEIKLVAFDQWGNKTSKKIIIERVMQTVESPYQFEELNPYKLKSKTSKNKLALVIGIEEYESIPNANFADRDAQFFIDYVQRGLGVPENKIKFFFNENAKERSKFEMIKWLKKNITTDTEVYLYFSGHGLAINEGQELYLLANDTITDFIEETAINRNEIFKAIAENNPKNVTAFLDTCYSGAGRADDQMLLAMAKGLVVVNEQQKKLPDNFTLFTAASAQESAWSLPEAQHGTFSYFLMKGMEGNADLNGDKKLTNGELRDYLIDNVGRYAQQQQTPQMVGDPNQILIKF